MFGVLEFSTFLSSIVKTASRNCFDTDKNVCTRRQYTILARALKLKHFGKPKTTQKSNTRGQ
jgi:hypothetical protein